MRSTVSKEDLIFVHKTGGKMHFVCVVILLVFCKIYFICKVVAICDQVNDVETVHDPN